jgi:hypothetical protein
MSIREGWLESHLSHVFLLTIEDMKRAISSKFTLLPLGFISVLSLVCVTMLAWWPSAQGSTPTVSRTTAQEGMFFYATGLLEDIAPEADGCVLHVAVYEWRSLSAGFRLEHIPQQNDRYALAATNDVCNAARMALEGASGHVAFQARSMSGMWHVTERPMPALGCGGLATNWRPPEL